MASKIFVFETCFRAKGSPETRQVKALLFGDQGFGANRDGSNTGEFPQNENVDEGVNVDVGSHPVEPRTPWIKILDSKQIFQY